MSMYNVKMNDRDKKLAKASKYKLNEEIKINNLVGEKKNEN